MTQAPTVQACYSANTNCLNAFLLKNHGKAPSVAAYSASTAAIREAKYSFEHSGKNLSSA